MDTATRFYDVDGRSFRQASNDIDALVGAIDGVYWKKVKKENLALVKISITFSGHRVSEKHLLDVVIEYYGKMLGRSVTPKIAEIKLYESAQN